MAGEQKKGAGGGNTPKPGSKAPKPVSGSPSAKDASRAQSRPISGKKPVGKGGNTPRPGGKSQPTPGPRRMSGALVAWGAVGLVIIIIVVLVIVKATRAPDMRRGPGVG